MIAVDVQEIHAPETQPPAEQGGLLASIGVSHSPSYRGVRACLVDTH